MLDSLLKNDEVVITLVRFIQALGKALEDCLKERTKSDGTRPR